MKNRKRCPKCGGTDILRVEGKAGAVFRKEQEDVEKLEGRSLANHFFQVIGKPDDKLNQIYGV